MSVSFPLRSIFSRFSLTRGFSLVELLISISIIGIITSVVLVKFTDFDSTTILKGTAYEVASSIREAQVLSISVLGAGNDFRRTYGIHFEEGSKDYMLFSTIAGASIPIYAVTDRITTYSLSRGIFVKDICVKLTSGTTHCDIASADISFRRPEFASLVYAKKDGSGSYDSTDGIQHVTIKIESTKGTNIWNIEVGALGHISVKKNP